MKLNYGSRCCEFYTEENLRVPAGYPADTVAYAIRRLFQTEERVRYDCTLRSVRLRLIARGGGQEQRVRYVVPAPRMGFRRGYCEVDAVVDAEGIRVQAFRKRRALPAEQREEAVRVFAGPIRKKAKTEKPGEAQ